MNIFLPYETNFRESVRALDDKRLNKQILECYQLINNVVKERKGEKVVGYKNHPIYLHYKQYFKALILYAWNCCMEYLDRFEKFHALHNQINWLYLTEVDTSIAIPFTPFYMQGSKGQPNYIRTTEKVVYETVDYCYEDLKKAEKRIAELEKENETKTDTITDLLKKQEFYEKEKLKQFAERLKEKLGGVDLIRGWSVKVFIDETVKEFKGD